MHISRRTFLLQTLAATGLLSAKHAPFSGFRWFTNDRLNYQELQHGWELQITGLVKNPQHFSLADFQILSNNQVSGLPMHQLLSLAKPLKRARYMIVHCGNCTRCIDIASACSDTTILAYSDMTKHGMRIELVAKESVNKIG